MQIIFFTSIEKMIDNTDHKIVEALLQRDSEITIDFFYKRCFPLFKAVYDNYYTDCHSCIEFINEIYLHIMTPDRETGVCKLQKFRFESTFFTWLKTVCVFYCYKRYNRKTRVEVDRLSEFFDDDGVRLPLSSDSIIMEDSLQRDDIETILQLMPNRRYSMLIRLRYLEEHSNEETAHILGMNMNTFYNKHKCAKEQFIKTLKTEESQNGQF